MPDVALSVIIVNWNGVRYLPECLAALVPQLPVGAELIVVENGSTDGSREWLMQQPAVLLVALLVGRLSHERTRLCRPLGAVPVPLFIALRVPTRGRVSLSHQIPFP